MVAVEVGAGYVKAMSETWAIVTGGNRGLGLGTCRRLGQLGQSVLLTARTGSKAEAAAQELRDEGLRVEGAALDVGRDDSVRSFVPVLGQRNVSILVNNAGAMFREQGDDPFDVPTEVVAEAISVNALGAYRLLAHLLPRMNEAGYGRVVNVSSGLGALDDMGGGWTAYRISKTSLNAVTRVFAAVAHPNVKVNSVCPGWVQTDMGGPDAPRTLEQGVSGIVWAATLEENGPSGGFFRDGEAIAW